MFVVLYPAAWIKKNCGTRTEEIIGGHEICIPIGKLDFIFMQTAAAELQKKA